jgi:hypothetical protein
MTSYKKVRTKCKVLLALGTVLGFAYCGGSLSSIVLAAGAPDETKRSEPIPFPDGVADQEHKVAYVSSPKGGIQAIRLEDGKVLWTNDTCPAEPWLVAGDRVIARGARLAILDLKNEGKLFRESDAFEYPKVEVLDRCTVAFHLWAPHVTDNVLEANWYAVASIDRSKGRPFNFQGWTGFNKQAPVGTVKVKLDTGRVELQSDPKPADVSGAMMPEAARPESQMPGGLPEKLTEVWHQYFKDQNGRISKQGQRLVGVSMTLEKVGQGYNKKVDLNTWDLKTGTAADPIELIKDNAQNIANIVITQDRNHAAVQFSTSTLTIYSLKDGKVVAKDIKAGASPEQAFVHSNHLYYTELGGGRGAETPNSLKAIDLENGKLAWERPLKPRSTIPLPP